MPVDWSIALSIRVSLPVGQQRAAVAAVGAHHERRLLLVLADLVERFLRQVKLTKIGFSWVIVTSAVLSVACTRLPLSTSRAPSRPSIGERMSA